MEGNAIGKGLEIVSPGVLGHVCFVAMLLDFASSDLGFQGLELGGVCGGSGCALLQTSCTNPIAPNRASLVPPKEFLRTPPKQLREQLPPRAVGSSRTKDLHTFVP